MAPEAKLIQRAKQAEPCVSIIGMAGSGKSTIGQLLAKKLGWAFMDTDSLIESAYATRLQDISEALDREAFLDTEAAIVLSLRASRVVIATGGSVVYRDRAMQHLKQLGTIVSLDAPTAVIAERIACNPERGLIIGEGQTLDSLCQERKILYDHYADLHCDATQSATSCADWIASSLPDSYKEKGL